MTRQSRMNKKRAIAFMLTGLFMVQQTMALSVFAAGVVSSGVTGTANGKGGTTYNIDPTKTNGNTGFRQYSDFNLGANDIANLNFADINTFVNLVDKQIVINGIVNSMKNGGFYNGKAVFVSPNGMVVGASGVLNVGSLGVYTPTQGNYDSLVKNQTEAGLNSIMNSNGSADITINGKIISAGDVHLQGGQVDVAKGAGIIGGVNSASMSVLSSQEQANALFSNLVNTANLTNGSDFVSNGKGQIIIKSQNGTNIHGDIVNYAKGGEYTGPSSTNHSSIEILNYGTNGVNITGNIANAKGLVQLDNNRGDMNVGGNIKNDGTTQIYNNPFSAFTPVDPNTGLTISGNIDTKGQLNIRNKGGKGLNISGTINHDGNAYVQNGYLADEIGYDYQEQSKKNNTGAMNITGTFNTTGNATFLNTEHGVDGMNVSGTVNVGGKGTYTNHGAAGLNIKNNGKIVSGNGLEMLNTGNGGLNITGTAENTGVAKVTNEAGRLTIGGTFKNNGNATVLNNGTELNVSGTVNNKNGVLDMRNNGADGFNVEETATITANGGLKMQNYGAGGLNVNGKVDSTTSAYYYNEGTAGMNLNGTITNNGTANVLNKAGALLIGGSFTNTGDATFTNDGNNLTINGSVANNGGTLNMTNANGAFDINGTVSNDNNTNLTNNGANGLNVNGTVTNNGGTLAMLNTGAKGLNIAQAGKVNAKGLRMENRGAEGLNINGTVTNVGTAEVLNQAGALLVGGSFTNTGDATFTNNGTNLTVNGSVTNKGKTLTMSNKNGAFDVNGSVSNEGTTTTMTNAGANGLNVNGSVFSNGDLTMTNTGAKGVNIASAGRVNGNNNITINNNSKGGVNVKGLVNAKNNVKVQSNNGNVVIGDETENDNYITAGKNIDITVNNGSLLNYGVVKTLLNAGGDLNMDVTDGTIGLGVQQKGCEGSGCTGIGEMADGSRDFSKSINASIRGKVTAKTTKATTKENDLVINYAAIDSDMNIDTIKADGRVILTVDDMAHIKTGKPSGTRYNMVNARPDDNSKTNIEGTGISLIANGSIGTKDNKVTFIQTGAKDGYSMDALANENIYLKENSFNDANYGREKEIDTNKVCTMIAREGDLDVEFAGNTTIENITAEGDMKIVTRGKEMHIKNLGHIEDDSVTPADYFGPRHDGYEFDGRYDKDDHKSEVLPNSVVVKALDINHNIRPTEELVDGGHEAWAGSTVRIDNAVLDNGTLDITADNVYANGIAAHFNKDGFSKVRDNSTSKVKGTTEIPTGHAVRPDDVTDTGRGETERNYYYPEGDGDGIFDGVPSDVDPDDGIVDATPLEIPDDPEEPPTPPTPPEPPAPPKDEDPNYEGDGRVTWKKQTEDNIDNIDKRQYMRFNVSDTKNPVALERSNNIDGLIDVSRGGIAVKHNNTLKVGDVVPVHLTYGDLDIQADVKVVTASTNRAGTMFVNLDQATANKLLYLNILLEDSMNLSFNQ